MFKHEPVQRQQLTRHTDSDGSRYYLTDDNCKLQSVTTILSALNSDAIASWRRSVGEQQADKISKQALTRGSAVHLLCERFLANDSDYSNGAMPFNLSEFNKIKPILEQNVDVVYGIELQLYSKLLRAAGTTDLFCKWNGVNSIVDFKTSKKVKYKDQIRHYFIQATCYAIMCEQLYSIKVPQIVIVMIVDHDQPIVFIERKNDFLADCAQIFIKDREKC